MNIQGRRDWEFESKGGALPWAMAVDTQRAVHLFGGQRSAMQAETVAMFLGRKAMAKNAGEVFRRDANPVVTDLDSDGTLRGAAHMDFEPFFCGGLFVHGVFRIAQQVHKNLQDLVPIN